jgi:uncharacterized membrane protein (UPF0127 family)
MALLLVGLIAAGCHHGCHQAEPRPRGEPEVILKTRAGEQHVRVEIARSEPDRQLGLMYRRSLESGRGMIFLWDQPQPLKFWMKNTYIPLDMIFIGGDLRVVYIEESAEPLTTNVRGPDENTQYVLEVPGGWARAHGVERGTAVKFVDLE